MESLNLLRLRIRDTDALVRTARVRSVAAPELEPEFRHSLGDTPYDWKRHRGFSAAASASLDAADTHLDTLTDAGDDVGFSGSSARSALVRSRAVGEQLEEAALELRGVEEQVGAANSSLEQVESGMGAATTTLDSLDESAATLKANRPRIP